MENRQTFFRYLINTSLLRRVVPALLGGALLGCARPDPQGAGREFARLRCDCTAAKDAQTYGRSQQLEKRLAAGAIASRTQLYDELAVLDRAIGARDSACRMQATAFRFRAQVDFVKEADRLTFLNAAQASYAQCQLEQERTARARPRIDLSTLAAGLPADAPANKPGK